MGRRSSRLQEGVRQSQSDIAGGATQPICRADPQSQPAFRWGDGWNRPPSARLAPFPPAQRNVRSWNGVCGFCGAEGETRHYQLFLQAVGTLAEGQRREQQRADSKVSTVGYRHRTDIRPGTVPIPTKPPLVSEMIAPPCSEMMSPPGYGTVLAMAVVVSLAAVVKPLDGIWRGACSRRRGRDGGRCARAGRGWHRHRSDRRSPRATPRSAAGW